jgi:hypothetical protein
MTQEQERLTVDGSVIDYDTAPGVPQMREGLKNYFEHRIPTGDFMRSVLSNDLRGAVGRADSQNIYLLHEYVSWLWNEAPAGAWGSPAKVDAWLSRTD